MILPIGDQPNPRNFTPLVTYALLAVNVAAFVLVSLPLMSQAAEVSDPTFRLYLEMLMRQHPGVDPRRLAAGISAYDLFVIEWGYRPAAPSIATLFSSMFLHGGWAHLLGNMLFLWIYGDNAEHRLGHLGYLLAYLLTGVMGTLSFALFVPAATGHVPLVGASGAISGVLGLYFLWFPRNKVRLLVFIVFFIDVWTVPARLVLGFYLLADNLLPFLLQGGAASGVAHGAHIGGFVGGLALAYGIDRVNLLRRERRARRGAASQAGGQGLPSSVGGGASGVVAAYERRDLSGAVLAYFGLPAHERRQVPAALAADLGQWLASANEVDGALAIYRRALSDHPRGPQRDRLLLGTGLLLLRAKNRPTAAYPYLLDVLDASPAPANAAAAREALGEIAQLQKLPFGARRGPN